MMNNPFRRSNSKIILPYFIQRGLLRLLILKLLESNDMTGIDIMRSLEQHTDELWKPSPGSIYPLLSELKGKGFIDPARIDGRSTTYRISEIGRDILKDLRSKKHSILRKLRTSQLFWISLMNPKDRVDFYFSIINSVIGKLSEVANSFENREQLLQYFNETMDNLTSLANSLKHED